MPVSSDSTPPTSSPPETTNQSTLSLQIGLFRIFRIDGILHSVVLCVRFLSPSITFPRSIHVGARVGA